MPTHKRKSPRKTSGMPPTYYGSPETTSRKALKPQSKFRHKIGYKESRNKSPAVGRKRSTNLSSESSYEDEEIESDSENKKRASKTMVSTRSERIRGEVVTTNDNDDDMDGVGKGNDSPELSITRFRKSIYNSDDDSERVRSRMNKKKRKKDDDDDSDQGGSVTNEMRIKDDEIAKLKRTVKTLETKIKDMRRTSTSSTSRDKMGWTGEELMFVKEINDYCRDKLYPKTKFLPKKWQEYLPDDRTSLYTACMKHLSIPEGSDKRDIWERVIVRSIRDKYQGMRCNMNNKINAIYMSMRYLTECTIAYIIIHVLTKLL